MRCFTARALVLLFCFAATIVVADDKETPDDATPRVTVVVFRKLSSKESSALEAIVTKLRAKHETEAVLFVSADLSTKGARHQSKLLLNALGIGEVWTSKARVAGNLVLIDMEDGVVSRPLTAKDGEKTIGAALAKALEPKDESDDKEDEEEAPDDGVDDGGR